MAKQLGGKELRVLVEVRDHEIQADYGRKRKQIRKKESRDCIGSPVRFEVLVGLRELGGKEG